MGGVVGPRMGVESTTGRDATRERGKPLRRRDSPIPFGDARSGRKEGSSTEHEEESQITERCAGCYPVVERRRNAEEEERHREK